MDSKKIYELLKYSEKESELYMPNEIFEDLKMYIKNTPHIAFAYTYMYFVTWSYRYAKYFNVNEIIDNKRIKELLGYAPKNQTLDYIIKKNGILDQIEYTESTRDFPLSWEFKKSTESELFFMSSSVQSDIPYFASIPKRFFLKRPLKGFYRIIREEGVEYEEAGTFYDVSNTHCIPFEVLVWCISKPEIGCIGFYLYAFLKHKNDLFKNGYDISIDKLATYTGIARRTLNNYLGTLKGFGMIDFRFNQEFFVSGMKKEDRKATTYSIRSHSHFNYSPTPFKKISYKTNLQYMELQNRMEVYSGAQKHKED